MDQPILLALIFSIPCAVAVVGGIWLLSHFVSRADNYQSSKTEDVSDNQLDNELLNRKNRQQANRPPTHPPLSNTRRERNASSASRRRVGGRRHLTTVDNNSYGIGTCDSGVDVGGDSDGGCSD